MPDSGSEAGLSRTIVPALSLRRPVARVLAAAGALEELRAAARERGWPAMHVIAALVAPGAGRRTRRRLATQRREVIIAERIVEPPVFGRLPLLVALAVPDTAAAGPLAAEEVRDRIARWAAAENGGAAVALPMRMPLRRVTRRERAPDPLRA